MKTSLDCIPCFVRQALVAARFVTTDTAVHERIVRDVLRTAAEMDLAMSPPVTGQKIHQRMRETAGVDDPYRTAKDRHNRLALAMLPALTAKVSAAGDQLATATRLAIAGNVIDLGVDDGIAEADLRLAVAQAFSEPLAGNLNGFRHAIAEATDILYLADNAGEIVFDRLLIQQLLPLPVTLGVRGSPVINDATVVDARAAGLEQIVEVIGNGSNAPGTILTDCSDEFRRRFDEADMIIAKGQGNFETLSDVAANIFFLLKVKCPVIASHVGLRTGTHVIARPNSANSASEGRDYARI